MKRSTASERYLLFVDESGDHVFHDEATLAQPAHRFLALLGCWFSSSAYASFCGALAAVKRRHFVGKADQVVLHREDIINRRGPFAILRVAERRASFDADVLALVREAEFRFSLVVVDKLRQKTTHESVWHPYHTALNFLLQRYCGFLNNVTRARGDVTAESRGGHEDRLLKESYERLCQRGDRYHAGGWYRQMLTSRKLKVKPKMANVASLQLADILVHPAKQRLLADQRFIPDPARSFGARVEEAAKDKYNRNVRTDSIEGYGRVLYPRPR